MAAAWLAGVPPRPAWASAPGLAITVPASASLGTFPTGARTASVLFGTITVTTTGSVNSSVAFTATVSATDFITGGGTTYERVVNSSIGYWSGPATASSGHATACTPGQLNAAVAVTLAAPQTAFTCTGTVFTGGSSLSWRPTLTVNIGPSNVVGTYTSTVTHSVV